LISASVPTRAEGPDVATAVFLKVLIAVIASAEVAAGD